MNITQHKTYHLLQLQLYVSHSEALIKTKKQNHKTYGYQKIVLIDMC